MKQPKISVVIIYGNIENKADDIISSLNNQTFDNYEVVFVNCAASEASINALSKLIAGSERIRILTLPGNLDYEFAKNSGLDIVSGDYVCFVDDCENLAPDFIKNIYYSNLKQGKCKVITENNRLYKRSFIENHTDINEIIKIKVEEKISEIFSKLEEHANYVKDQFNDCYKNTDTAVNNKIYNINARCSALEELIYEKENILHEKLNAVIQKMEKSSEIGCKTSDAQRAEIYNYITSKVDETHHDIGRIYEEIAKNSEFSRKIIEETKNNLYSEISSLNEKVNNLYSEQEIKYNSLRNMVENIREDFNARIETLSLTSDSDNIDKINRIADLINFEKNMNMNFDRIYSYINEKNAAFYEELTAFYKEINEKINK